MCRFMRVLGSTRGTKHGKSFTMMGDFNEISNPNEKKGGVQVDIRKCQNFNNRINDMTVVWWRLLQQGLSLLGGDLSGSHSLQYNVSWRLRFHDGIAKVFPHVQSDHHPIIVHTEQLEIDFVYLRVWCLIWFWKYAIYKRLSWNNWSSSQQWTISNLNLFKYYGKSL